MVFPVLELREKNGVWKSISFPMINTWAVLGPTLWPRRRAGRRLDGSCTHATLIQSWAHKGPVREVITLRSRKSLCELACEHVGYGLISLVWVGLCSFEAECAPAQNIINHSFFIVIAGLSKIWLKNFKKQEGLAPPTGIITIKKREEKTTSLSSGLQPGSLGKRERERKKMGSIIQVALAIC